MKKEQAEKQQAGAGPHPGAEEKGSDDNTVDADFEVEGEKKKGKKK